MASKSLDEAINQALFIGELNVSLFKERLKVQLRDYFAHQIMLEMGRYDSNEVEVALKLFFDRIFHDVPAVKNVK